jgi:cation diffusion facilitator CzcD-associated flavoprotein CzcO
MLPGMNDPGAPARFTAVIVGSGFAGLGMGYYLKQAGIDSFVILEKAAELGGTWRENTYPGSGCDIPSHLYSFSFDLGYPWGWRYGKQAEILDYLRQVARKFDLARHIRFNCEVEGADFDEGRGVWRIRLADGGTLEARFLVTAVGQLHRPAIPELPGAARFGGTAFHSARWDHSCALRGKSVAVIGTGASAIQFVPEIAREVRQLYVFQRSPGWIIPKVEKAFSGFFKWLLARVPLLLRIDRLRIFAITETLAKGYEGNRVLEKLATALARFHLWRQVRDPALRARLTPDFPIGCKRILLSNDWLPALQRPNVELVTEPVAELTAGGIRTRDGRERAVDVVIYGTGFSATEFLAPLQIRGLGGRTLQEAWQAGAEAYYGISVAGFPNFMVLYGPNTNLGSGSIIFMLEQQQRHVVRLIRARQAAGWRYVDVRAEAQAAWAQEIRVRSAATTYMGACHSWYRTADGRNTVNWIGTQTEYAARLRRLDLGDYFGAPAAEAPAPAPAVAA